MRNFFSILILLLFTLTGSGQEFKKHPGESYEEFALKNKPQKSEKIAFLKIKKWNSQEGLFVFYEDEFQHDNFSSNDQTYKRLIGKLFLKTSNDYEYRRISIDTIYPEGGDPTIEDLFFANADKDQSQELILITTWNQKHYQIHGKLYGSFIYDDLKNLKRDELYFFKSISDSLSGGFDGNREGKIVNSKYKNREEIISKLREMYK